MLGIADLHTPEAVAAAESAITGCQPVFPLAVSSSGSESEDSSDDDDDSDYDKHNDSEKQDKKTVPPMKFKKSKSLKDNSLDESVGDRKSKEQPKIIELHSPPISNGSGLEQEIKNGAF